ncbi:MAG: uracil-DNA glycosylase, partial [Micavibrio aeruginosavorus]
RFLFKLSTDPLMHRLQAMDKELRRDMHKTKAFVRFRKVEEDDGDHYIAWHKPDHKILSLVASFFTTRFGVMKWTIMTPRETMNWDGEKLTFGSGVTKEDAPQEDQLEDLWRDYYRATFNPARIKIKSMKREMPVRHWATLPETSIIQDMLAEAPMRVQKMIETQEGNARSAEDFLPNDTCYISLKKASLGCQGCDLYKCATQTIFGEGPIDAPFMIIGEQPGNDEDLAGKVFVGPAGRILDKALNEAGFDRQQIYITNAVKHFKFRVEREKRMHRSPDAKDINACKPWLLAELELVKPKLVLCMGATAAKSLIGHGYTLKKEHGKWFDGPNDIKMTGTYHPSAVLRNQTNDHDNTIYETIVDDLKKMKQALTG